MEKLAKIFYVLIAVILLVLGCGDPSTARSEKDEDIPEIVDEDMDQDIIFTETDPNNTDQEVIDEDAAIPENCGNNILDPEEGCELGETQICSNIGTFTTAAEVPCLPDCSGWDVSLCSTCGNGIKEDAENCEIGGIIDCGLIPNKNYKAGVTTHCNATCSGWDETLCTTLSCGNGQLDEGELCEQGSSIDCSSISSKYKAGDTTTCNIGCTAWNDIEDCTLVSCGDGVTNVGEICDGDSLACEAVPNANYVAGGVAYCNSSCNGWDGSQECELCGNGVTDEGEECDDANSFSGDSCSPDCTNTMAFVSKGSFMMGCNPEVEQNCSYDALPYHKVTLSDYWIDKYEVTVGQYRECITAGACNNSDAQMQHYASAAFPLPTAGKDNYPMTLVTRAGAQAYCNWVGKRLPTEAEWEKAARGTDERLYPWGNSPDSTNQAYAILPSEQQTPNKQEVTPPRTLGASPYGAYDMLGNVAEIVADCYQENWYGQSNVQDPTGPKAQSYGSCPCNIRGGSYNLGYKYTTHSRKAESCLDLTHMLLPNIGFRCSK